MNAKLMTRQVNGSLGFVMVVCVMYTLGDSTPILKAIQAGEYSILQIFHRAVGSNAGAILMYVFVLLMDLAATIGGYASASHILW
jgi:hypothetical protein